MHQFPNVNIDNILIFSPSVQEHVSHVCQVLKPLDIYLIIKLEKCEFHQPSVKFLLYTLHKHGVEIDKAKVRVVISYSQLHMT